MRSLSLALLFWLFHPLSNAFAIAPQNAKNSDLSVVRYEASRAGCSASITADGKYTYTIATADFDIAMAVEARELQIVRHRIEPLVGILLTIRYRGDSALDFSANAITLQFIKHFKLLQPAIDPDDYTDKIQADEARLDDETRRIVQKHPDRRAARTARQQDYEKSVTDLIEFLARHSLRPAHLDRAHPQTSGWIFFDTSSQWLSEWKPQEELVLRVPLNGSRFEFPFKLPPQKGQLLMRKRD